MLASFFDSTLPPWVTQILTTFGGTMFGSLVGYKLARLSRVFEKRHDFLLDQLRNFYSPMLVLRADIVLQTLLHMNESEPERVDLTEFERNV
jgi:hypothetical protein